MQKSGNTLLTNLSAYIHDAFPRNATKEIARRIDGISDRQARRIVETGKAPGKLHSLLIALLDEQYARQQRAREARHEVVRAYRFQAMAGRTAARVSHAPNAREPKVAGLPDGTEEPVLTFGVSDKEAL
jgi:hypothetical protein